MKKLEEARENNGFKNVWTIEGCIMFKDANDKLSLAYILVNWLKHPVKRIRFLVCVTRAVICSYGNFHLE